MRSEMQNPQQRTQTHPYESLTPDAVLQALEEREWYCDGRITALNSYENRVYMLYLEDGQAVVVKFYRPNRWTDLAILEEHQFLHQLAESEVPVIQPLSHHGETLFHFQHHRFALFPRQPGRAPEVGQDSTLEWIGRYLGRIHAIGATKLFEHRHQITVQELGRANLLWLSQHNVVPQHLQDSWSSIAHKVLDQCDQLFKRYNQAPMLRLHGDCHLGNILWLDQAYKNLSAGPWFLDFDDCCSGPAIQDFWMLLSGDDYERQHQLNSLLIGYEDFMSFDWSQIKLIEAMRTLRLIAYTAWLAKRWDDPAFPIAFPWFDTHAYWHEHIIQLNEQGQKMDAILTNS